MAWIYLLLVGLLEIMWAIGLKHAEGYTASAPSVIPGAATVAGMLFVALALRKRPVGTGCAIGTGIGAAGTAILGNVLFAARASPARLGCVGLTVAGIVGLKLVTGA
jgi:quaternary ammonium compound-resistance protein SugE